MKSLLASIIILAISILSLNASACSCSEYPIAQDSALEGYMLDQFGVEITENDVTPLKYYPTYSEKLIAYNNNSETNSCIGESFDGKKMHYCSRSRKYMYRVELKEKNCSIKIRVKTTYRKAKFKVFSNNCN